MTIDLDFDKNYIWHPYTSMLNPLPGYPVVSASGCELTLEGGKTIVDGMSSWWCAIHGYNVPALNDAVITQLGKMSHVMFGGITHQPAVDLCKKLVNLMPTDLNKVFLADSGSVSVEVALKMALQYWKGLGVEHKTKFAALTHAYHGDTFAAMSVCDPVNGMHSLFSGFMPNNLFIETPPIGYDRPVDETLIAGWRASISKHQNELAAIIVEPVVQGAGGMRIYNPAYLEILRELCDEHNILLIFDEIATGFGRTGKSFGFSHANVIPDIICLGKALTGGYMTLSATITSKQVAEGICKSEAGVFMHGPTFMGNPLACSVANASLDIFNQGDWKDQTLLIEKALERGLLPLQQSPMVESVRVLGAIGVVEMKQVVDVAAVQKRWVEQGVWIRPFGKLVYIMPPYVISKAQLHMLISAIADFVNA